MGHTIVIQRDSNGWVTESTDSTSTCTNTVISIFPDDMTIKSTGKNGSKFREAESLCRLLKAIFGHVLDAQTVSKYFS